MPFEPAPGLVVANRYRLERLVGEGGMGAVWAATHSITRKTLALKFLKAPEKQRADLTRRFLREARAASAVEHPNIVQIHDVLELDDGTPVMVMEMLAGESLQQRLERDGRIELGELAELMISVVSAVGAAHAAGVVHRDLKPDNIFLARGAGVSGGITVKVLDFGIAKVSFAGESAGTGALTGTGSLLGTPFYMSPEQVGGEKDLDFRSDVWALGIILYQCLAGVLPTQGENIGQILKLIMVGPIQPLAEAAPWLPADLLSTVEHMLCRERARRLSELRQVYEVLARHVGAGPLRLAFFARLAERGALPAGELAAQSRIPAPAVDRSPPLETALGPASFQPLAPGGGPRRAPNLPTAPFPPHNEPAPIVPSSAYTQSPLSGTLPGLPKRSLAPVLGLAIGGVLVLGLAVGALRGFGSAGHVAVPSAPVSASAAVPAPDASAPPSLPDAGPLVEPAVGPPPVASSAMPPATPPVTARPRPPGAAPAKPAARKSPPPTPSANLHPGID